MEILTESKRRSYDPPTTVPARFGSSFTIPTKIFAQQIIDSEIDVPSMPCRMRPIFTMTHCITPRWNRVWIMKLK